MQKFTINLDCFETKIKFIVGFTEEESEKLGCGGCLGLCQKYDHRNVTIYVQNINRVDVAVHEIFHAIMFITSEKDIVDEETRAYLMDYMYRKYISKIQK